VTSAALADRRPARLAPLSLVPADADHLSWLESEAIHILREVAGQCRNPALSSGGKDSLVLLRLAEKAFRPGRFPFRCCTSTPGTIFRRSSRFATAVLPSLASG
jgi:sulfate adenylyltransferase subunit 2